MTRDDDTFNVRRIVHHPQTELERLAELLAEKVAERIRPPEPPEPRPHRSRANSEWDTYAGFRAYFVNLEARAREDTEHVTKELLAGMAGINPKTIARTQRRHGLDPRLWPPTAWPERAPLRKPWRLHSSASAAAVWMGTWWMLDFVSDGRMDGIIRTACWVIFGMRHSLG